MHNAWITTAGEKMSKSLGNSLLIPAVLERVRGIELRYYMVAAHYRSHVEFSFEALDDAATAFRRIEDFLDRAAPVVGTWFAALPDTFIAAMDDDLGTPAAVAVIHDAVREGNRLLAAGPSEALGQKFGEVVAMLDVLGLNPADAAWATRGNDSAEALTNVIDALVQGLLAERAAARDAKDWARADAIRDQIKRAGVEVEDTPTGPKWSV
jgi:cysteinyl-tRNA synthetase